MQIGSQKHRQEYFTVTLPKEINQSIWFLDFQIHSFQNQMDSLRKQKAEAELKLERKEFPSAGEGRKAIRLIDEAIARAMMGIANFESQQRDLRERLVELQEYAKAQGWTTE
ncbi:MAG: hypothetical protein AB7U82_28680 [Blastocatellales bacterium]